MLRLTRTEWDFLIAMGLFTVAFWGAVLYFIGIALRGTGGQ